MKRIAVGISGGIDSAVCAYLLKEQGYQITAVFLRLVDFLPTYPPAKIAEFLKIDYLEYDFREEFKKRIIDYFVKSYFRGETPNPCVMCNKYIKFGLFLNKTKEMGFNNIATGHYVRKRLLKNRYLLLRGVDIQKEQSYFLSLLSQYQISQCLWPLGELSKAKVKEIALSIGLPNRNVKESQEICFIPNNNYRNFLVNYIPPHLKKEGDIVDTQGKVLGRHRGLWNYTIGQRKGLGICASEPYYVKKIDLEHNRLIVAPRRELFFKRVIVTKVNFFPFDYLERPLYVTIKIRYKSKPAPAVIEPLDKTSIRINFESPQFGVTPGQIAVFYGEEVCIGGGIIKEAL